MTIVLTSRGHDRAAQQAALLQRGKHVVVAPPDLEPRARDTLRFVELSSRMSTKTGVAPRSTKAFAVDTKV
jgi:hypothetical protein